MNFENICLTSGVIVINLCLLVTSKPDPQFSSQEQINSNPFYGFNQNLPNQISYQNSDGFFNQAATARYYEQQNPQTENYNPSTRYDPSNSNYYSSDFRSSNPQFNPNSAQTNSFPSNSQFSGFNNNLQYSGFPNNPQGFSQDPNRPAFPNQLNNPQGFPQDPNSPAFPNQLNNPQGFPQDPNRPAFPNQLNNPQGFPQDPNRPAFPNQAPVSYIPPQELIALLTNLDNLGSQQCSENVYAQWEYETNINDITQLGALAAQQRYALFQRELWEVLKQIDYRRVPDQRFWRQLRYLSMVGPSALPIDEYERYNRMISEMVAVYNQASICAYNEPFRCGLHLNPDLTLIMARSRDWDELQHTWVEWRRHTGQYVKDIYDQLVDLTNEAAKLNNFTNAADMWNFGYESPNLEIELEEVWDQIRPLYEQLHAFVRRKLRDLYGPEKINNRAPLPSHILGNMWAQSWTNILDVTLPYPGKNFLDVTPNMQAQGYTPLTMVQLAEEFFLSMNMSAMPPEFWAGSIITEIPERIINCQASAWDFCNRRDYRLKVCAQINMKDFVSMHHELAHIQYFLQYRDQPKVFRDGANPAFHEAVGEAIALSVSSPTHLQKIGLIQTSIDELPIDLNYLFSIAMDKLPFLPFAYVMDKWRWDVFRRVVSKGQFNCHWHSLRERYLGVKPPLLRSEFDFDPGAKYHIPANVPYIRYFFSTVLQFQLYRHMCRVAGQFDPNDPQKPLHRCDIYRSTEAGNVLKELMRHGTSLTWNEVLLRATGESRLDGTAVRDFFRPLEEWLRNENLRTQEYPGWIYDGDYCKYSIETAGLSVSGGFYNSSSLISPNIIVIILSLIILIFFITCKKY